MRRINVGENALRLRIRSIAIFCAVLILAVSSVQMANAATFTVSNLSDSGAGSLRDAITAANAAPGADTINFTTGAGTINLLTPLPAITDTVTINAGATPTVELDGSGTSATSASIGFYVRAGGCQIQGFIINGFKGDAGIRMDTDGTGTDNGNTIIANYIGTNTAGTAADANANRGILIVGTTGHFIGDGTASGRNVISGNSGRGIEITANGSATIDGNYIGTDAAGTADVGNLGHGIQIVNSSNSVIGTAGNGNLISGNDGSGIKIIGDIGTPASNNTISSNLIGVNAGGNTALNNSGSGVTIEGNNNFVTNGNVLSGNSVNGVSIGSSLATGNFVTGNFIGVGADGTTAIGNVASGVRISNLANGNTIGGTNVTPGMCDNACNLIANNGDTGSLTARAGINVDSTAGVSNTIRGNSIFSNGTTGTFNGLGIDLHMPNTTANDADDPDTGANNQQNFPVITLAESNGTIQGTLDSTASTTFAVDFYGNTAADGANSEGRTFLGATTVMTDASGDATFNFATTATLVAGDFVTATATTLNSSLSPQAVGDTSELSAPFAVVASTGGSGNGIEGDVAPRTDGDGTINSTDVVQVRRFSIGLDTYDTNTNEYQRADSAPLNSNGDGQVTSTDVVQTRRFQVGLDSQQNASGPTQSSPFANPIDNTKFAGKANISNFGGSRVIRVIDTNATAGQQVTVDIGVDAVGDEASYGFSLNYDVNALSNPVVSIGTAGGSVLSNPNNPGEIGFSVDFGGGTIGAGNNQILVRVQFDVNAGASPGTTNLFFDDTPAIRSVSDTNANSLPATFTAGDVTIAAPRTIRVVDTNGTVGQQVTVNIETDAVGDEASYGFSLNYDSNVLTNPVVAIGTAGGNVLSNTNVVGQIGVSVDFGGGTIAAGNNQLLITVTFDVSPSAGEGSTPITFGDTPAARSTSNTSAEPLSTAYTDGNVNIVAARRLKIIDTSGVIPQQVTVMIEADAQGNEASYGFSVDYNPKHLTNPVVMIGADAQAAGGSVLANTSNAGKIGVSVDFGGGTMSAGDNQSFVKITFDILSTAPEVVTALTFSDTPAVRSVSDTNANSLPQTYENGTVTITTPREVRAVFVQTSAGQQVTVQLEVDALGDESTYGFSVSYDQTKLSNPVVSMGTVGGEVTANTTTPGEIGISVDFSGNPPFSASPANTIPAGNNQNLVNIQFNVAPSAPAGNTPIMFTNSPAAQNVSNPAAQALAVNFFGNNVLILAPTAATATISGHLTTSSGQPISSVFVLLTDSSTGQPSRVRTDSNGMFIFEDLQVGRTYIVGPATKKYDFSPASRALTLNEDFTGADFAGTARENLSDKN